MNRNQQVACAVMSALAAGSQLAIAADTSASSGIDEIVVTAQRRNESIQNVPITIQALTGDSLQQLNVTNFSDMLRYTPNVTFSGNGPGTGNIFMRGLSAGGSGNQSQSTTAPMPNVALYLDDQSMQFPARNNDVYLVDMERVEVLEGPQGTLFGGGAQAGAIRYITNKPVLNKFEAITNMGYGVTAGGDPNNNLNATINLPVNDKFAIRMVMFEDHRGGYISNIAGTIQLKANGSGTGNAASAIGNNGNLVGSNQNYTDTSGFRLSGLYQVNDDWNVLVQQNYQNFGSNGSFAAEPIFPDGQTATNPYQVSAFTPQFDKDRYESTSVTVNGKIGDLKAVYTGSYMVRHIDQQADYSNYLTSQHGSYYDCSGQHAGYAYFRSSKPSTCYAPIGSWEDTVTNSHQSHEIRLSTDETKRARILFGGYWENFDIKDVMNFNYMPIPQCNAANLAISKAGGADCVEAVGPIPGYYATNPSLRTGQNTAFGEDVDRGYTQTAFFTSFDYDLIPKTLTFTGGIRFYHYDEYERGSEYYSATSSILNVANGTPYGAKGAAAYGFGMNLDKKESGNRKRANLTWHINSDTMAYYTYSEGFRPGGFNRTSSSIDGSVVTLKAVAPYCASGVSGANCVKQYYKPEGYNSDNLINNEIGFKSELFNRRVQFNASAYDMNWNNIQMSLFDPVHLGNTTFDVNGASYKIRGVEVQLIAKVVDGLTIQGSSSWNSSSQSNSPCLQANVPGSPNYGSCIVQISGQAYTNPYGVLGTAPAFSPSAQFNVRARYDWVMGSTNAFWSLGVNHVDSMRNEPASFPDGNSPSQVVPTTTLLLYTIPAASTVDGSIGIDKDNWNAQITGSNLTNNSSPTNISSGQFIKQEFPMRPRVLTLQVGYKF